MKSFLALLSVLISCLSGRAQLHISGVVTDADTKKPVPFVNIGVPAKGIGTVAAEDGTFTLSLPDSVSQSGLMFSSIGYTPVIIKIESITDHSAVKIELKPYSQNLAEVTIKPLKEKILGNQIDSRTVQAGFTSNALGCEVGVLQKIKKGKPTRIKNFGFFVSATKYDTVMYRVNVYEMDKHGNPGPNILHENIIGYITKTGWTVIDMLPYEIVVNHNFLVTLEWIRDPGKRGDAGLMFSAGFLASPLFARRASQDEFKKTGTVGLGFYTTVLY